MTNMKTYMYLEPTLFHNYSKQCSLLISMCKHDECGHAGNVNYSCGYRAAHAHKCIVLSITCDE